MKKTSMWSFTLLLFCSLFQFNVFAQAGGGGVGSGGNVDDPPPIPPPAIVSSNWINDMNSHNCVVLQDDNATIKLFLVVTFGIPNVEGNAQPMYISADYGGNLFTLGPILDSDIELKEIKGFGMAYQAYYPISFMYDVNCPYDGEGEYPFALDFTVSLTLANGDLYPVDSYPLIFPDDLLGNDEAGNPIPLNPVYAGTKAVCCHGQEGAESRSAGLSKEVLTTSIAQPNPFDDHLLVTYGLEEAAQVNIQLVDLNGRIVAEKSSYENRKGEYQTRIDTSPLHSGFYFCIVKTDLETKMLKVLKTE